MSVYRAAILDDNVLGKDAMATRHKVLRTLRELYSLDSDILLFRALRELWDADQQDRRGQVLRILA